MYDTILTKLVYAHLNMQYGYYNLFRFVTIVALGHAQKAFLINCVALYGIWSFIAWFLIMHGINRGFSLC